MKPPPLLLGAALLFWGWQTEYVVVGAVMALLLEAPRAVKARWEFSNQDFARIWTFCSLLLLATLVYAFTENRGPAGFSELFQNPTLSAQRSASNASARTAAAMMRWLPMIFFLFVAAQAYSTREGVPLETISLILRRRWKKARARGEPMPPSRSLNVAYPYFGMCLFSASVHPGRDTYFFWGLCALLAWALWSQRSRRVGLVTWGAALALAIGLGYYGQLGIGRIQHLLDTLNPQWLMASGRMRFDPARSQTELGTVGRIKASGKIVIWVDSGKGSPPPLLREASYRTWERRTWSAGFGEEQFVSLYPTELNGTTFVLVGGKTNLAKVNLACYLPGGKALLPLPEGTARLENLMAYDLRQNPLGAVLETGPGLVVFDAHYGPGATSDSPPDTIEDLDVPGREADALNQVIAELGLDRNQPRRQILRALTGFFMDKFTYSTYQPPPPRRTRSGESPLARFLLRTRRGHCEYFATAGVLLLRQLGIPARYAVGFAVHEGSGGKYVVRLRDAHAWCLVWNAEAAQWENLDLTPATWTAIEGEQASAFEFLGDFWSRIRFEFSKFRWGQSHWRQYLLWAVLPVLLILLYQIIFRRRQRQKRRAGLADAAAEWPGLDSEFYLLERQLARSGLVRQPSEPLSEWLGRAAAAPTLADLRAPLLELLHLHYRYRFDPQGLNRDERERLRERARVCLAQLRHSAPAPG